MSIPFTDNIPYDLIVEFNNQLYKIQVKTTRLIKNDGMMFDTNRTNPFKMTNIKYTPSEVDYFFLYCIENEWCGIIKATDFDSKNLNMRLLPPRNNNFNKTKMAIDYEFDHRINEIKYGEQIPLTVFDVKHKKSNKGKEEVDKEKKIVNNIPNRVTRDELKSLIRNKPFTQIGEMFDVSDNAIRKWCVRMGLPDKSTHIKRYSDSEWEKM